MIANFDYTAFADELGFTKVATQEEIAAQGYSLSIPLYVKRMQANGDNGDTHSLPELWAAWEQEGCLFWQEMVTLTEILNELKTGKERYE